MDKSICKLIILAFLLMNIYGCVALLAGAVGGAGTGVWLSDKLTQEVNVPSDKCLSAVKSALKALRLQITKETVKEEVAQVMGKYSDGRTIWIDINRVSQRVSRIEVRVGVPGDKEAARKILDKINRNL